MTKFARKPKPLPVSVFPLPKNRGALRAAAEMAAEWADPPFSMERALDSLEKWRGSARSEAEIFIAFRRGGEAGILCGRTGRLWPDGGKVATAPLVWAKGRMRGGRNGKAEPPVSTQDRDAATTALTAAFLEWSRERGATAARAGEFMQTARTARGAEFDGKAFGEWMAQAGRKGGKGGKRGRGDGFALGAEEGGKLRGILGGWLEPHPLAEGGLAVALAGGGKRIRSEV